MRTVLGYALILAMTAPFAIYFIEKEKRDIRYNFSVIEHALDRF